MLLTSTLSASQRNTTFSSFIKRFRWLDGFFHLVYPEICVVCEDELAISEETVCSHCMQELNFTHFEDYTEPTILDQLFWGRVQIEQTYSLLYYSKTNSSKPVLHTLKYQKRPDVGVQFGRIIGNKFNQLASIKDADVLLPVPIHPKKEYIRGYNQSYQLALGIHQTTSLPIDTSFIQRIKNDKSQTTLGRFKRWDNVTNKFSLNSSINRYKHVIIVDDVITTGSTIETIANEIKKQFPDIKISVVSLALAN